MLELSVYEGIPHLLAPVVTDMRQAGAALNWCVAEMDRRYKLMSALVGAQPRELQPEGARGHREEAAAQASVHPHARQSRGPRAAAAAGGGDRRARRPDDGVGQEGRGADRAARAEVARVRHSPDPRHAAPVGGRDHRPHQGERADAHRVPGLGARSTRAPSSTSRAPRACSGRATCSTSRRATGIPTRVPRRVRRRRRSASRGRGAEEAGRGAVHRGHPRRARAAAS